MWWALAGAEVAFDVAIVGGGLVGLALAHALASAGLRPAVIEQASGGASEPADDYDQRAIALSFSAARILATAGGGTALWRSLEDAATPIRAVHVSEQGRFGRVQLCADELSVPALGYVAAGGVVGKALRDSVRERPDVTVLSPARLIGLSIRRGSARLRVCRDGKIVPVEAKVVVAADGGRSIVRMLIGAPARTRDYASRALIANVTASRGHEGTAYERFTRTGPLALLPMGERRFGVVWTADPAKLDELLAIDDAHFLLALRATFGARVGEFVRVGRRASFPLHRVSAVRKLHPRVVLIGNAANHLHPVAGQGFNLGLRDVAALSECLVEAHHQGEDIGGPRTLAEYMAGREGDHRRTVAFTDSLAGLFVAELPGLPVARNLAMLGLDAAGPLKRAFARQAMGVRGNRARLARGEALR